MSVIFVQNIFGYVKPFIFGLAFSIMIIMETDIFVFDNSHFSATQCVDWEHTLETCKVDLKGFSVNLNST